MMFICLFLLLWEESIFHSIAS
uniref:Uncharacterized protein n=1 Tax=Rhizophora mucronata TaxID=61149 RepID=A0A2P2Q174_RHIMU